MVAVRRLFAPDARLVADLSVYGLTIDLQHVVDAGREDEGGHDHAAVIGVNLDRRLVDIEVEHYVAGVGVELNLTLDNGNLAEE